MQAVQLHGYGDVDQLRYEEVATPEPQPNEVLIKVAATSVNPIDWKIRSGAAKDLFPTTFPAILGCDVAGTVVALGRDVRHLEVGQQVMGMVNKSYAEYLTTPANILTVIPDGIALKEAAALPLVTTTGGQLAQSLEIKQGHVVLITGAMGSVGRTAVFAAKGMGARVVAGVKLDQKHNAGDIGADQVVAMDDEQERNGLPELDAIGDTVGHDLIGKLIAKLKSGGVLGSVLGPVKEAEGKNIRVKMVGATPDASMLRQMADAVRDGKLIIPIAKTMKLSEAGEAQQLSEKGSLGGKILLLP